MSEEYKLVEVHVPTQEEMQDSAMSLLKPNQQRFVHMYLSGQYTLKQTSELLGVSLYTIRSWLRNPQIKGIIDEIQAEEDDIVRQGLKAIRMSALYKMQELLNSNMDGIAYQAARDILDRTGHKAPTKQETKIEIYTFEEQLKDAIKHIPNQQEFIDVEDYEIVK